MAKKKLNDEDFEVEESGFSASASVAKLPMDIRGGKKILEDFMSLPVNMLDPFARKDGSDFSRPSGRFHDAFLETIKSVGIIEPLTVRAKEDGRYEILAGETRWSVGMEAGLKVVPCHIINVDDNMARKIFSWTNLMRRDLTVRDRINGWWQYYTSVKEAGELSSLREDSNQDGLNQYAASGERLSYRQIMRYVALHNLTSEWIDLLEVDEETSKPVITIRIGYEVSKLSEGEQEELLPYAALLTEKSVTDVVSLSKGELEDSEGDPIPWNDENLLKVVSGKNFKSAESTANPDSAAGTNPTPTMEKQFAKFRPKIISVAKKYLRQEDYDRAPEVIQEALELYYKMKEQE